MAPKKKASSPKVAVASGGGPTGGPPSFVLLSDLHAHLWTAFSKGDGAQNSRLRRSLQVLEDSLVKAQELGVPWVFAGDIVHTAGYTHNVVLAELTAVLAKYPDVSKLAVWGNHDARGVGGLITVEQTVFATLQHAVPRLTVFDTTTGRTPTLFQAADGLTYSGAGYQPREELLTYAPPSDIGIYHQTIRGTKTPSGFVLEEGLHAEELFKRHRVVVVGHVHHWQYIPTKMSSEMLLIPGSPEHHNFGDMGEHGWWVISAGAEPSAVMHPGGSPHFLTVDSPAEVARHSPHFFRVRSVPAGEVLPDGVAAIAPGPTTVESRDVLRGARGDQILSAWLKEAPPVEGLPAARYLEVGRELLGTSDVGTLRDLRLRSIALKNFCSYDDQAVDIQPGTWLVLGRGKDFPSNGAGKSSLFESVYWALFGKTTKGLSGDEVIRWGTDECAVTVTFDGSVPEDWLRVTRSRGKSSALLVETPDGPLEAKSVIEMTDKLAQYIGVTPELYQALGYFSQERLLLFASATDGERKEMLADLIGLTAYQEAATAAQQKATVFESESQRLDTLHTAAKAQVVSEKQRLVEVFAQCTEWDERQAVDVTAAATTLARFDQTAAQEQERLTQEAMGRTGRQLDERAETAEGRRLVVQTHLLDLDGQPTATRDEANAAVRSHTAAVGVCHRIRDAQVTTDRQLESARARLAQETASVAAGTCPSCGQAVTPEHAGRCLAPAQAEVGRLESEVRRLADEYAPALAHASEWDAYVQSVAAAAMNASTREQLTKEREHLQAALADIERLRTELEVSARAGAASSLATQRGALARTDAEVRARVNPYSASRKSTAERIAKGQKDVARYAEEHLKCAGELALLEYWRKGFSKQGIQSLLVDEVAGLFNQERGTIFPALTQGVYDVQFSTVSQTRAGDMREKTEFHVYEHGQLVPYAALSGGQRRRVDVGVMLTLVKGVSRWMQVPGVLGLLVLDEVFGFLDGSGAEGLVEALREVQTRIPTIFVVAHDPQLQALFPEAIVVEQGQDGISRIRAEGHES